MNRTLHVRPFLLICSLLGCNTYTHDNSCHDAPKNYYLILGVDRSATRADIKRSYITLAKKEHPDRHRLQHHETQHSTATHISFSDITAAYKTLSDDTMRRIYDNELDAEAARRRYASWSCVHFVYDLYTFYLQNYSCIAMCMPCVAVIEDCL